MSGDNNPIGSITVSPQAIATIAYHAALESYGVVTDSQLPESMEAFAAILSKSAYATQSFTGPEPPGTLSPESVTSFRLFEISEQLFTGMFWF